MPSHALFYVEEYCQGKKAASKRVFVLNINIYMKTHLLALGLSPRVDTNIQLLLMNILRLRVVVFKGNVRKNSYFMVIPTVK